MLAMGFAQSKPSSEPRKQAASVPFVGCESARWGQETVHALMSADFASRLAYYKSEHGLGRGVGTDLVCMGRVDTPYT